MSDNCRAAGATAVTAVLCASAFVAIRNADGHLAPGAVLMSWLILGQVPWPLTIVGGALCLAGVAVSRSRDPGFRRRGLPPLDRPGKGPGRPLPPHR